MNTVKQLGLYTLIFVLIIALILLGYRSKKLKATLVKLLKTQHALELQKITEKRKVLREEVKNLDAKRREKASRFRKYLAEYKRSK